MANLLSVELLLTLTAVTLTAWAVAIGIGLRVLARLRAAEKSRAELARSVDAFFARADEASRERSRFSARMETLRFEDRAPQRLTPPAPGLPPKPSEPTSILSMQ